MLKLLFCITTVVPTAIPPPPSPTSITSYNPCYSLCYAITLYYHCSDNDNSTAAITTFNSNDSRYYVEYHAVRHNGSTSVSINTRNAFGVFCVWALHIACIQM